MSGSKAPLALPAGPSSLSPRGAVLQAVVHRAPDPWGEHRRWAWERGLDDVALASWDRLVTAAAVPSEAEERALRLCLLALGHEVNEGSSALELGEAPGHDALLQKLADLELLSLDAEGRPGELAEALAAVLDRSLRTAGTAIGGPGSRSPLIVDNGALFFHYLRAAEVNVAGRLSALLPPRATAESRFEIDDVCVALRSILLDAPPKAPSGAPWKLAPHQLQATVQSAVDRLMLLTGGAGTGKTSVVTSILRLFAALGVPADRLLLAAPTGRAANRLTETVKASLASLGASALPSDLELMTALPEGRTLHRLLGYTAAKRTFKVNRDAPLAADLVIVDEVSMVDITMMASLLDALPRDRPLTLVLVGDPDQLPAVGTGDVLRQLTSARTVVTATRRKLLEQAVSLVDGAALPPVSDREADPTPGELGLCERYVSLTEVFRQADDEGGRRVQALATEVRSGDTQGVADALIVSDDPKGLSFTGAELLSAKPRSDASEALLARWAAELLSPKEWAQQLDGGFAPDDADGLKALLRWSTSARALCFTHRGPAGEAYVNGRLSLLVDPSRATGPGGAHSFHYAGAPVLVVKNDYTVGLFNGDQGVVARVKTPAGTRLEAIFPGGERPKRIPIGRLPPAKLSYAMTVHKAQGSEYGRVLVVLPDGHNRLLRRETMYTAVTRSREGVVIVGSPELLQRAVATTVNRTSRVRRRVVDAIESNSPQAG